MLSEFLSFTGFVDFIILIFIVNISLMMLIHVLVRKGVVTTPL